MLAFVVDSETAKTTCTATFNYEQTKPTVPPVVTPGTSSFTLLLLLIVIGGTVYYFRHWFVWMYRLLQGARHVPATQDHGSVEEMGEDTKKLSIDTSASNVRGPTDEWEANNRPGGDVTAKDGTGKEIKKPVPLARKKLAGAREAED